MTKHAKPEERSPADWTREDIATEVGRLEATMRLAPTEEGSGSVSIFDRFHDRILTFVKAVGFYVEETAAAISPAADAGESVMLLRVPRSLRKRTITSTGLPASCAPCR